MAVEIVELEIHRNAAYLARRQVRLLVSTEAVEMLAENGFDRKFGARALHREVRKRSLPPLANAVATHEASCGPRVIEVSADDDRKTVSCRVHDGDSF